MEIKLDNEQLSTALQAAILQSIGETGREAIIKHVVSEITKTSDSYGRKQGLLWDIIRDQGERIATAILKDKLEKDTEFISFLESIYVEGVRLFMGDAKSREKMIENVAAATRKAITGDRY
jgi:hypothetical protein